MRNTNLIQWDVLDCRTMPARVYRLDFNQTAEASYEVVQNAPGKTVHLAEVHNIPYLKACGAALRHISHLEQHSCIVRELPLQTDSTKAAA